MIGNNIVQNTNEASMKKPKKDTRTETKLNCPAMSRYQLSVALMRMLEVQTKTDLSGSQNHPIHLAPFGGWVGFLSREPSKIRDRLVLS